MALVRDHIQRISVNSNYQNNSTVVYRNDLKSSSEGISIGKYYKIM